ncbi:hypothetical protein NQL31_001291 [Lotmaria passim]
MGLVFSMFIVRTCSMLYETLPKSSSSTSHWKCGPSTRPFSSSGTSSTAPCMCTWNVSAKLPMRSDFSSIRSLTASPGASEPCEGVKRNLLAKSTAGGTAGSVVEGVPAMTGTGGMIMNWHSIADVFSIVTKYSCTALR